MRRFAVLIALFLVLCLLSLSALAQSPPETPPPTAPQAPTPTAAPVMVVITPTPAVPPVPPLPFGLDKTLQPLLGVLRTFGFWRTLGLLALAGLIGLVIKFWSEISGRIAKYGADQAESAGKSLSSLFRGKPDPCRQALLKDTLDRCTQLELKGFVREHVTIVSLESLYVPLFAPPERTPGGDLARRGEAGLLLASGEAELEKPVPLTQLFARHRCPVLVGEAGSGKTTVMRYVALTLAQALSSGRPNLVLERLGWESLPDPLPLPLFVPLSGFGLYLSGLEDADKPEPDARFLLEYLEEKRFAGLNLPPDYLETQLNEGHCLVLLDGLDEVARFEDRSFISETVTLFSKRYEGSYVAVTCRPEGYQKGAQLGGDFRRYNVQPLAWPDDVIRFIATWNRGVLESQEAAADNAADFLGRLEDTPQVRELTNNPLLLTVMAIVHYNVGTLPERRADLYDHCTELLLGWDTRWGRVLAAPPRWLDERPAKERRLPLEKLAFAWQVENVLEARRPAVEETLTSEFLTGRDEAHQQEAMRRANQYLDWVVQRSYLMRELGNTLSFYRRAFQEYLAARRLTRDPKLFDERLGEVLPLDWWEETVLLAVGHLSNADPERGRALLSAILDTPDQSAAPHRHATLAARALLEAAPGFQSESWEVRAAITERLEAALHAGGNTFTPSARVAAGEALGALGDARDLGEMVRVPSGPFSMGSSAEELAFWKDFIHHQIYEEEAEGYRPPEGESKEWLYDVYCTWLDAEEGVHELEIDEFWIRRYLITNAQYQEFMEAAGYDQPHYWTQAGWTWRQGEPVREWQQTDRPDFWDDPRFNGPNRPVVGVTWYEASAYCRWLTEVSDHAYRLPNEAEWEKAARGGDRRQWPWGDGWDENKANTREGGLQSTNPVGIYPEGQSPFGALDMVGNVWEWCSTLWGETWRQPDFGYPYRADDGREDLDAAGARLLRGGSWSFFRNLARCAARNRYDLLRRQRRVSAGLPRLSGILSSWLPGILAGWFPESW